VGSFIALVPLAVILYLVLDALAGLPRRLRPPPICHTRPLSGHPSTPTGRAASGKRGAITVQSIPAVPPG